MKISIIVAMAKNRVIGVDNTLPWHLPADLKYFKAVTMGKPIIMGRKTFESIGKALPGRQNIVVTRNRAWTADGVTVAHSLEDAFALADNGSAELMVIGGAQLYREALPKVSKLYVTEVGLAPSGDAFFPQISDTDWREVARDQHGADGDLPAHAFVTYERA